jgi:hypothetical protein
MTLQSISKKLAQIDPLGKVKQKQLAIETMKLKPLFSFRRTIICAGKKSIIAISYCDDRNSL